jgi:hypothetical protein
MPREIFHWDVLERAVEKMPPGPLREVIQQHSALAHLGAVAHDAPYYWRFGKELFSHVAEALHGTQGQDTLLPLQLIADRAQRLEERTQRAELWAFLAGMLSHYATDVVVHPLVYYFTGDYNHPDATARNLAQSRHRLFETYLDSFCRKRFRQNREVRIGSFLSANRPAVARICKILDSLPAPYGLAEGNGTGAIWFGSLRYMARLQRVFFSPTVGFAVRAADAICRRRLRNADALFSFCRRKANSFFDEPLTFQNPISGSSESSSVLALRDRAVSDFLILAARLDTLLINLLAGADSAEAGKLFTGIAPRSLNCGVADYAGKTPTHFSPQPPPLGGML